MEIDKNTSRTISFLRFPLIICVISIHTVFTLDKSFEGYEYFKYMLGLFTSFAVPIFFIISSFLFFHGMQDFDISKWHDKLKSRVKTLVIPYLFWNFCYLMFMLAVQLLIPNMMGGGRKMIYDYSFWEVLDSFWNFGGMYYGMPILYSFWFIRNLIVLNLLAPIFYLFLKKQPILFFIIGLIVFIFNPFHFIPTEMDWVKSVLFYGFGTFCAIHRFDFTNIRKLFYPLIIFVILSILILPFMVGNVQLYWSQLLLVIGSLSMPTVVRKGIQYRNLRVNKVLVSSSFFVYAFHLFIIVPFNKLWPIMVPVNSWTASIMLIVIPVIVSSICVFVYCVIKRYCSTLTELMVGGR